MNGGKWAPAYYTPSPQHLSFMSGGRPDRPLTVRCKFDQTNKKISFSSARNCSYNLLRSKVEQCFSLYGSSFSIAYRDDDGEVSTIYTDFDLTEAVQYFQAGADDPPLSSGSSILSGRSFGPKKITLYVHVTVDYDGPSLSDTSSIRSMDDFRDSISQRSFSLGAPSERELDDDSVTVSSKDRISTSPYSSDRSGSWTKLSSQNVFSSDSSTGTPQPKYQTVGSSQTSLQPGSGSEKSHGSSPLRSVSSAEVKTPEAPSKAFDLTRLEQSTEGGISSPGAESNPLLGRGAAWLKDQNDRVLRSKGVLPEPSISDGDSLSIDGEDIEGSLALEQDPRGRYYYSYNSTGSSAAPDEDSSMIQNPFHDVHKVRPNSMQLSWLAEQQKEHQPKSNPSLLSHNSDPLPSRPAPLPEAQDEIPREVLDLIEPVPPSEDSLTQCSECGVTLDYMRYICSTCGEKSPASLTKGKGKGLQDHTYPPAYLNGGSSYGSGTFSDPRSSVGSSRSMSSSSSGSRPLPQVPGLARSSPPSLLVPGSPPVKEKGYELCPSCIESAGVTHAIEAGLSPALSSPLSSSPHSPESSQWRRAGPTQKGQLRHAYREKMWGHFGWEDVMQDEAGTSKCSTCETTARGRRYKCASCKNFSVCKGCYGLIHDLHPLHAFLHVPDPLTRSSSHSEADSHNSPSLGVNVVGDADSLVHSGVRCAHCLLEIVGARFHCAVCESVDICQNCESAGVANSLDEGSHTSGHILIKIPYPLENNEVQTVSKKAVDLWKRRDGLEAGFSGTRSRRNSLGSSYARTVMGNGKEDAIAADDVDHKLPCNSCHKSIIGIRYQCAHCPSLPHAYSLCSECEQRSYEVHDPEHVFFKLPRRVQRPIESPTAMLPPMYSTRAGPPPGRHCRDPTEYLQHLNHKDVICDLCMNPITGEWYHCAHCAQDLCDNCNENYNHNVCHVFMVFKGEVSSKAIREMQVDPDNPSSRPTIPYSVYFREETQ